jgi:hypothetical protein
MIIGFQESRPFAIDEFAYDYPFLKLDVQLPGVRSMLDHTVVVIEFHQTQTIPQLVSSGIEGGTGTNYLDKGKPLFVQGFADGFG